MKSSGLLLPNSTMSRPISCLDSAHSCGDDSPAMSRHQVPHVSITEGYSDESCQLASKDETHVE